MTETPKRRLKQPVRVKEEGGFVILTIGPKSGPNASTRLTPNEADDLSDLLAVNAKMARVENEE